MAGRFPVSLLLEAQYTVEEIPGVNPVRGPVCASTGRRHAWGKIPAPLSEACVRPVRGPVCASIARRGGDNSQCPSIPLDRLSVRLNGLISREQLQLCPAGFSSLHRRHCLLLGISEEPTGHSTFRLRLSRSPHTQETVSPNSDHTPRNAEGRSICIKAEKIVGDRGPKGMRDSKPAGSTSCVLMNLKRAIWTGVPSRRPALVTWVVERTLGRVSTTSGTTELGTLLTPADYSGFRSSVVDPLCHADIGEPRPEVWTYFRGEPARSCGFDSGFVCMGFTACLQAKCSSAEQLQKLDQGVVVRLGGAQGEELRYDVRNWRVLPEENSSDEPNEFWEKIHTH
ncbi:hypothetical protein B0H13DRAFT_1892626 [Mycena leptocephala]|nr:hypothetical protein B0H13DRAFT_1892626 [Mycena leptocephala]